MAIVFWAISSLRLVESLLIGMTLLLNRWLARRRRVAAEAAMRTAFD